MKNDTENARDLDILEQIENNPDSTQASIADKLGVAVGTVNWHLKRLVDKGCVKIQRCERRKLKYIITPEGLAMRGRLTLDYINSSLELYRLIRSRMSTVLSEYEGLTDHSVFIDGDGDVADICRLTCMEHGWRALSGKESAALYVKIVGLKLFAEVPEAEYAEE